MPKTRYIVVHPNGVEEVESGDAAAGHGTIQDRINVTLVDGTEHQYFATNSKSVGYEISDSGILTIHDDGPDPLRTYSPSAWSFADGGIPEVERQSQGRVAGTGRNRP